MRTGIGYHLEKQRERAKIAADIAEFLRRGGIITQLRDPGAEEQPSKQRSLYCPVRLGFDMGV
jgi:hypothetical protein